LNATMVPNLSNQSAWWVLLCRKYRTSAWFGDVI
jgi:hypothetical protein